MRDDLLEQVKTLYYERKLGVPEISSLLKKDQKSLYSLMKREGLSRRSFKEISAQRFQNKPLSFNLKQHLTTKERNLKIAGIMLYWGEGAKEGYGIDFANSNPSIILVFLAFLREVCGVDEKRLRVYLYCYGNQDAEELKRYWSGVSNIPLLQFTKPYVRKNPGGKSKRRMQYGMVHIRYSDKKLLKQINDWIMEYTKTT